MTILRSGATKKYSENWAKAFGKKKSKTAKTSAQQKNTKKHKTKNKSKK